MKFELIGGPLDGATIETPANAIHPELIHFSESRRIHHYLCHGNTEFRYLSPDTVVDDESRFERWWKSRNADPSAKAVAWEAWSKVLEQF